MEDKAGVEVPGWEGGCNASNGVHADAPPKPCDRSVRDPRAQPSASSWRRARCPAISGCVPHARVSADVQVGEELRVKQVDGDGAGKVVLAQAQGHQAAPVLQRVVHLCLASGAGPERRASDKSKLASFPCAACRRTGPSSGRRPKVHPPLLLGAPR